MTFNKTPSVKEKFITAARNGQLEDVIKMSKAFRGLNCQLASELLIETCMEGHKNVVQWLVENTTADINYKGEITLKSAILKQDQPFFFTPLTAACYNGHLDIVKFMVETCRARVNLLDKGGFTPLTVACHRGKFSVSKYLINKLNNFEINFTNKKKLNTALHYAIWCTKQDRTPLHEACQTRDVPKVIELVYVQGHDINALDNRGCTSLHSACYYGFGDIVQILMMAGADETITNDYKCTPAQLAKKMGRIEVLELLDRDCFCMERA